VLHYDFEQSIGYWLTLTTQAYHRSICEELEPHGITYRQSMVLGWLALEGELSQTDLAARLMVEPPTLVGILDRMERDGWISRNSCPQDRRKKLIRAARSVGPVWRKVVQCAKRVRQRATAGMTDRELKDLRRLLERVRHNFQARPSASNGASRK
jgi:MarR family transcriptional regulator for hemolysin